MRLEVEFDVSNQRFEPSFGKIQTATKLVGEPYSGGYKIIPKVTEQTLLTKEKIMLDDVTIKEIPSYNVSNTVGGTTFYIATMDE